MSRNGSGVYSLPAGNPVVSGTTITSSWANNTMNDIASALTGSLAADGQTPATGNLNMANNRIISVADPFNAQDAATKAYADALIGGGGSAGVFTNVTDSALTSGRVTYASTGGLLVDSANLTFNGTTLTSTGFSGPLNGTVGATTPNTGAFTTLSASGAFAANGGATLGDASGDALTINSSAVSIPNGLNFDSNTLVIDATNNRVGVGVASPSNALEVNGTIASRTSAPVVLLTDSTATFGVNLGFYNGGSFYAYGQIALRDVTNSQTAYTYFAGASGYHNWFTNGSERMRIDSSGNVGIGTSSPTTRLSVVSGTNAGISVNDGTVNTIIYNSTGGVASIGTTTNHPVDFYTNNSAKMRIDSSGNVGIGTSSPFADTGYLSLDIRGSSTGSQINMGTTSTRVGQITCDTTNGLTLNTATATPLRFFTNGAEAARITSGGELLVGTTSAGANTKFTVNGNGYFAGTSGTGGRYIGFSNGTTSVDCYVGNYQSIMGSGSSEYALIYSTNRVYAIANTNGVYVATNGTSWTSASDERLKDIIEPISDASNKVCSLRAVIGKYKTDKEDARRSFLIAQDVQAVLPEAVDASNPDELGVQYTDVIPLLVAAIKEQQEMIEELKQEVAALKAK